MDAPVETELKLLASPEMLAELRLHPRLGGAEESIVYCATYFDTPSRSLERGGAALRLRTSPGGTEQTLKLTRVAAPALARTEWTVAAAPDRLDLSRFPAAARSALERLAPGSALAPVATAEFARTTRRVLAGHSEIELAFDLGTIGTGARTAPVCELELELKAGRSADLIALALALPLGPELQWSIASKTDRALALAFDLPAGASRARPVVLPAETTLAEGFRAIGWSALRHLLANYPLVLAEGDPEAVHQARVAIRRLRAALSLFKAEIAGPEGPVFRAQLKAVAEGLAPARDLHLLHDRAAAATHTSGYDYAPLLAALAEIRDAALPAAREMLAGEPFQRLLLEFALWLEAGAWLGEAGAAETARPLRPLAAQILSRQFGKVRKAAGPLGGMSDRDRHALRIEVKKLRYAAEFLGPLFPAAADRPARHFGRNLARLQDRLGELNDLAVASIAPAELGAGRDPVVAARLAAEFAELLEQDRAKARRRLLKAAQRPMDRLVEAPAWWKADQP